MTTKTISCDCVHTFQDERYGQNQRIHNLLKKDGTTTAKWRCVVCGSVKSSGIPANKLAQIAKEI